MQEHVEALPVLLVGNGAVVLEADNPGVAYVGAIEEGEEENEREDREDSVVWDGVVVRGVLHGVGVPGG